MNFSSSLDGWWCEGDRGYQTDDGWWYGGGGDKNDWKSDDVICGWPLRYFYPI